MNSLDIASNGEDMESASSDSELLQDSHSTIRRLRPSAARSLLFGGVCLFVVTALTSLVALSEHVPRGRAAQLLTSPRETVRSLMEGAELAKVATDNILAIGTPQHQDVQDQEHRRHLTMNSVVQALQNITSMIKKHDPEGFSKLDDVSVSDEEKAAVLKKLAIFKDSRMVNITQLVASLLSEGKQDPDALQGNLASRLAPKVEDLRSLAQEVFPGKPDVEESKSGNGIDMNLNKDQWKSHLEVDFQRRLSESNDEADIALREVMPQARLLLQHFEEAKGEAMPKSPSRLLQTSDGEDMSFMQCVTKAVPNPVAVCSCIASNMKEVMSMMMDFMQSKGSSSAR
mmetsp:Transcript_3677/g.8568  ORF Transcript_3677/g.8568 Transcript_3677/m.8568 type:complete len:343 (-) Transcript_3677:63-1091(-)|eukprot:CAMPEP_0206471538 /NCGR_PEP_ID=MMETSP0324_2-20121206/31629_1 /ASSEMBLY_ACC=CAM_ASM_000836 /TAXON_ID=2866 /ORGANISM="Crypthecodinium cohnii, Strain Seligo" /LENGTH=342 /DNA_ID=CAMNT_0053945895 /DNA_START=82 /DNA_END=1110 /DNA_ORIENTATION=+